MLQWPAVRKVAGGCSTFEQFTDITMSITVRFGAVRFRFTGGFGLGFEVGLWLLGYDAQMLIFWQNSSDSPSVYMSFILEADDRFLTMGWTSQHLHIFSYFGVSETSN